MKLWHLALAAPLALAACGGEDDPMDGGGGGTEACTEAHSLCATLHVPDDYGATPVQVIVGFFNELPPVGPPADVAAIVEEPSIAAGLPHEVEIHGMTTEGKYFIYVALYNEGGGMFTPKAGVDYVWGSDAKHDAAGPINLGDIALELYEE